MRLNSLIRRLLGRGAAAETTRRQVRRGPVTHIVLMDGTMSTLAPGAETNIGLIYKLMREVAPAAHLSVLYLKGIQWRTWASTRDVIEGRGTNRRIRRAYGFLASRYREGDTIHLFGYSRGAFAARSLAGMIDRMGLLRPEHATERNIRDLYRHYMNGADSAAARAFSRAHCYPSTQVEAIYIFDCVKALGQRLPLFWRLADHDADFHSHDLGPSMRHGYHALAHDETRMAYAPVLWTTKGALDRRVEQVWFRGSHGDVGGSLGDFTAARPLSNIPLVWMLERAEARGIPLPEGWRARFPTDPTAPTVGMNRGWGRLFLHRRRRVIGADPSERLHWTVTGDVPAMQVGATADAGSQGRLIS